MYVLQESEIMTIDRSAPFPLHISCNFLLHTPSATTPAATAPAAADAAT